ncbi:MAG: hypothetical protein R3Y67_07315 [Eubacteriales bacterium]
MKKTFTPCIIMILIALSLVSCKKDAELTTYETSMAELTESINTIHANIEGLDANDEASIELALSYLDEMDVTFQQMAALEVPEEFMAVESLADEASEYMTSSVSYYYTLFNTSPYDEYSATLAEENYTRAMKRQYYIGQILQGIVPEGDDIVVVTEEDESSEELEEEIDYEVVDDVPTVDLLEQ